MGVYIIMQTVTAVRAYERINNGCTKPYYIYCDDGNIYVAKFKQNPEGSRILVNEYVCAKIAEVLELPLSFPTLINVTPEFVNDYGKEISEHLLNNVHPGIHFGTRKVKKAYPITKTDMLIGAENIHVIPGIILFDHLVCNKDRDSNGGNLLFDQSKKEIVVIDHTHTFDLGAIWTAADLKQRIGQPFSSLCTSGYVYSKLVQFVKGNNPFCSVLEKMKCLNENVLGDIINNVPDEWEIDLSEKIALKAYLLDRLRRIGDVLPVLRPFYPFWKGGDYHRKSM